MKLNWAYVTAFIVLFFISGVIFMVVKSFSYKVELKDDNYYEKEINYQQVIDGKQNYKNLNQAIRVKDSLQFIVIDFPTKSINANTKGELRFVKNDDQSKDVTFGFNTLNTNYYTLAKDKFVKGFYDVEISWNTNDTAYFTNYSLFVQK
ncbi:MAG: FixH family protein [Chitinophagales bacterium]|nr:FixH family protein [Romboutsia sp.]MCB9034094.1 FixH family protein [Chitinophagales bacterium]